MNDFEFWDSEFPIEENNQVEKSNIYIFTSPRTGKTVEIPLLPDDIIVDGELRRIVRDETGKIPDWARKTNYSVDSVRITPEGTCYTKLGELAHLSKGDSLRVYGYSAAREKLLRVNKILAYTFKGALGVDEIRNHNEQLRCINDLPRGACKNCKAHRIWRHIFNRCYRDVPQWYNGCSVYEEWAYLSKFKEWYESNTYIIKSGSQLNIDKDIIKKGNKVYSPENCLIVPSYINGYFIGINKDKPAGVLILTNGKYRAFGFKWLTEDRQYLGVFKTHKEAHQAWAEFKTKQLHEVVLPYFINDVVEEDRNNPMVLKVIETLKNYTFE